MSCLCFINLSCLLFWISGLHIHSHHLQFLTPLISVIYCLLLNLNTNYKKIFALLIGFCVITQGGFSFWRAKSEFQRPYITDIGYTDDFNNFIYSTCPESKSISIVDPRGLHLLSSNRNLNNNFNCNNLLLVQNSHYEKSLIIQWFMKNNSVITDYSYKNYKIWTSNNLSIRH